MIAACHSCSTALIVRSQDTDSLSSFKHLVYGLRKLYQLFDKEELHLALPSIKRPDKLPVVLSKQEVKRLLKAAERILEKVMFPDL